MNDDWMERAQSAEAQLATLKDAIGPAKQRVQHFKENFGINERSNGELTVNFDKFVERLGQEGAFELRQIIDARYNISGAPGEKPRVKLEL